VIDPILTYSDLNLSATRGFVADPFLACDGDRLYLLFEVFVHEPREKFIGCAMRAADGKWRYLGPAIADDRHFYAFPFTFRFEGHWYCMPDVRSRAGGPALGTLFRAVDFPKDWEPVETLEVAGDDPALFRCQDAWYLVCADREGVWLHRAESPLSRRWTRVGRSPIATGPHLRRMAGRPIACDDGAILFYQDCSLHYGEMVRAFRLRGLPGETVRHEQMPCSPVVCGQYDHRWNHLGMHHVDWNLERGLVAVDGHNAEGWSIGLIEAEELRRLVPAPHELPWRPRLRRLVRTARRYVRQPRLIVEGIGGDGR